MMKYVHYECRLRALLGISDGLIKKTRREILVRDEDYALVQKKVAYTEEATKKVLDYLLNANTSSTKTLELVGAHQVQDILSSDEIRVVLEEKQGGDESVKIKKDARKPILLLNAGWVVPDCEMRFHRMPLNPKIVLGRIDPEWIEKHGVAFQLHTGADPERPQRVRVRSNVNFTRRLIIPCAWVQSNLWDCTRRAPRQRGKW